MDQIMDIHSGYLRTRYFYTRCDGPGDCGDGCEGDIFFSWLCPVAKKLDDESTAKPCCEACFAHLELGHKGYMLEYKTARELWPVFEVFKSCDCEEPEECICNCGQGATCIHGTD
jgi:hypothetical protein